MRLTIRILERVIITKNGKPEAVLMSFEEYEGWIETLEISRDVELVKAIEEGTADIQAGRLYSHDQVFKSKEVRTKTIKRK